MVESNLISASKSELAVACIRRAPVLPPVQASCAKPPGMARDSRASAVPVPTSETVTSLRGLTNVQRDVFSVSPLKSSETRLDGVDALLTARVALLLVAEP